MFIPAYKKPSILSMRSRQKQSHLEGNGHGKQFPLFQEYGMRLFSLPSERRSRNIQLPFLLLPPVFPAGMPRRTATGVKDCSLCPVPHQPEMYDHIIRKLSSAIRERAAKTVSEENPRQTSE